MTANMDQGQYASCTNCSVFFKCDGDSSAAISCLREAPHYDMEHGICNFAGFALCGWVDTENLTIDQCYIEPGDMGGGES